MDSVLKQCRVLYNKTFGDDGAFADMLFSSFSKDLRYITENGKLVCMAFCIDVFAQNKKGKYLYAVATSREYRNKGYMSRLFKIIEEEFKAEYDFLCLHPASKDLIELYKKKGFSLNLLGGKSVVVTKPDVLIKNEKELNRVLNNVLLEKSIKYSEEYLSLLLMYANVYCDSKEEPKTVYIEDKNGNFLNCFYKENPLTEFTSMSKPLKAFNLDNYYLAITLE